MVITKVRVATPPVRIGLGENCLVICGGWIAVNVAAAKPSAPVLTPV